MMERPICARIHPFGRLSGRLRSLDRATSASIVRLVGFLAVLLAVFSFARPASASSWIEIHTIQNFDSSITSPYMGDDVTTTGVVIAVLSDGFYIEDSGSTLDGYDESWDGDTCTSEGIYVYTGTGNVPSSVVLKAHVLVSGLVEASNDSSYGGTQIAVSDTGSDISVLSTGNSEPSTVGASTITTSINDGGCKEFSAGSFGQWLPFEGMLINVPSSSTLLVTQGTGGTVDTGAQTAVSNGQFWGLITSTTRTFRGPGIDVLDPAYIADETALAGQGVATWNGNPTLLLIDSKTLGGTALDASAGTEYTGSDDLVGIVDYHISSQGYTGLLLTSSAVSALSAQSGAAPVAASVRQSTDQILVGTLDLNSLVEGETKRIAKLANAVVNYMQSPDILAVQGATSAALTGLVSAVNTVYGSSAYTLSALSTTASGCASECLYNAFLINESKFDQASGAAPAVVQELAANTYTTTSGTTEPLFDRSPLLLTVGIQRKGIDDFVLNVVNANLMDRSELSAASTSEDARNRREQQADALTTGVLEPLENAGDHVMVAGGFNSFEFSDGYVDTLGIVDGQEANDVTVSTVWLYDTNYNSSTLVNSTTSATDLSLKETNPATNRYTYVESGSAEQPDHILYTSEMNSLLSVDYARFGADFPVSETYDTTTVARASNHDSVMVYFNVPYDTMTTLSSSPSTSVYGQPVTFTATVCVIASSTSTACASGADIPDGTVTFTYGSTTLCSAATLSSSGTATCDYSLLPVGEDTVTATYNGSSTNLGYQVSSGTTAQTVTQDTTVLSVAGSPNPSFSDEPVVFTATAEPTGGVGQAPTGTVTFTDTTTGASLGSGKLSAASGSVVSTASVTATLTEVETHTIQASYGGDTTDTSATATWNQEVNINSSSLVLSLTAGANPTYYGDSVTFTVVATAGYGTPSGTVAFNVNGAAVQAVQLTSGTASYTTTALPVGIDSIQVTYGGDGTHGAADSNTLSETVLPVYATISTLTCAPNPAAYQTQVTCTDVLASTGGTPGGTVTFYDGTTSLGTEAVSNGVATFSSSSLAVGSHTITAQYPRTDPFLAVTSNSVDEIIVSNFSLTAKPASGSIYTGEALDSTITVTPGDGFTLDVALACSGAPANTTCTMTPSTVSGGSGTSVLLVQTTAPSQTTTAASLGRKGGWPLLAGLVLLLVPKRLRRRRGWTAGVLLAAALAATTLTGCGGSGTLTGGTPPGAYTITVTGTAVDGTLTITETTTMALTVKSLF